MRPDPLERLREPGGTVEPHVPLRERPGGEVDVRVGEAGNDAAPLEVDDVALRDHPRLSRETKEKILYRNAQALFGIGARSATPA